MEKGKMKSKIFFFFVAYFTLICAHAQSIENDPIGVDNKKSLSVSIVFYNPATGKPRTVFYPGTEVGYKIKTVIPPRAKNNMASIKLAGALMVRGFEVPFKLRNQLTGELANPTGEELEIFGSKVWNGKFEIPDLAPESEFKVTATVDIEGVGTAVASKRIKIRSK
jgi:hypothetical protein